MGTSQSRLLSEGRRLNLYHAVRDGDHQRLAMFIQAFPEEARGTTFYEQGEKTTLATVAVRRGDCRSLNLLISARAPLEFSDDVNGWTPLVWAAQRGHTECVKALLRAGVDVNKTGPSLMTPLMAASQMGRRMCLTSLVQRGADLDTLDVARRPALSLAAVHNQVTCVQYLMEVGAQVPLELDASGKTILMHVAWNGHHHCLDYLLNNGETPLPTSFVNKGSEGSRRTALHDAAAMKWPRCVALLVHAGANVNVTDIDGQTPLMLAVGCNIARPNCNNTEVRKQIASYLLLVGANANARNKHGKNALECHFSQSSIDPDMVEILLVAGETEDSSTAENRANLAQCELSASFSCPLVDLHLSLRASVHCCSEHSLRPRKCLLQRCREGVHEARRQYEEQTGKFLRVQQHLILAAIQGQMTS